MRMCCLYSCCCMLAKLLSYLLCHVHVDVRCIHSCFFTCVSSKGGLYVSEGRTLKLFMHTHVQVCMEQLSTCLLRVFLSSLLFFSSPVLWEMVMSSFTSKTIDLYLPLEGPVREREKQNESRTEGKSYVSFAVSLDQ